MNVLFQIQVALAATPVPVVIVGGGDPHAQMNFIFTAVAAGTGVVAAVAGIAAAIYAYQTYQVETARPKLAIAMDTVGMAISRSGDAAQEVEFGIPIVNAGRTTEGLYVDLWFLNDPMKPHLVVGPSANPQWIQGDSESDYAGGRLLTWTRWTRYYRQHIPTDQQVDLEPIKVMVPPVDMGHRVLWRLRSADGSVFPKDGSRGTIDYAVALMPSGGA